MMEKFEINLFADPIISSFINIIPIVLIFATIFIYFISYKVAYKIYDKKEL